MSAMTAMTQQGEPGIELVGIRKAFGGVTLFDNLSLTVGRGERVAVFGPSGCGKTMLLRLIAGIHQPDAGDIRLAGRSVLDLEPEERGVGMAFQNFALYPHMPAFENIASPLKARREDAGSVAARVSGIARLLKIEHVLGHAPRELSNGQKQRTALARALVGAPEILLLDDPLRNVDAKLRYEMRLEFPKLLREFRSTVLYVTQDYKEAMALGERIAVMIAGRIVQYAPPAEVYARPAHVEVARLFGDPTINLVDSEIVEADGGAATVIAGVQISLGRTFADAIGRKVTLGLRPEALRPARAGDVVRLPATQIALTPLNQRLVTLFRAADGTELLSAAPAADSARTHVATELSIAPTDILLFDRQSGERIAPTSEQAEAPA